MSNFREHKIPKKSGGTRTIYIYKDDEMKKNHKRFLRNIKDIENKFNVEISSYAVGFTRYSLHESVKRHVSSNSFIQLDVSNFFPSITEDLMYEHVPLLMRFPEVRECFQDGKLCQGSVLAPWISNVYMYKFDIKLKEELNKLKLGSSTMTRYADDITISFKWYKGELKDIYASIITIVKSLLEEYGLELNVKKTQFRYSTKHNHVKVLGFNIVFKEDENFISIGRKTYTNPKKVYPFHNHAKKEIPRLKTLAYGKYSFKGKRELRKEELRKAETGKEE